MNNQKISIVIPTFNRAKYLMQCIDSCLNQTVACEIIVCDHGSSDNTPEAVKTYGNKIKYVRRELDSGVHFCWLDGILHTTNDLVHINFDDDWIEPTFVEESLKLFNADVGCVFTDAKVYFEAENRYESSGFNFQNNTGIFNSEELAKFNYISLTSPCAGTFRKKILIDNLFVGNVPFAQSSYHGVGPDILFSLMATIDYPKYGYVNKPLAIFRAHENSITIDAMKDEVKLLKIKKAYRDARTFYFLTKFNKRLLQNKLFRKLLIKKK